MPIDPRPGEERSEFMSRCISKETEAGFGNEQAVAICAAQWEGERTDDENPVPPQGVREAAEQGLEYRSEYGRGGTDTGIARARDLAAGKGIPPETLARMRSFFARHEQNRVPPTEKTEPDGGPTNGWIAWMLWGGDAGRRWAESQREKEDSMALRIDFADEPIRMTMTDEGYLTGEARVARVGIQSYMNGDGSVRKEYRPVDEVFSADAISSFKNRPVTVGHPDELVTAENAKRLSVGMVGENIRADGRWLVMPLTITDGDTIRQIADGMVELSAGYMADVEDAEGDFEGEMYDAIQRGIRGNHVAVVDRARAGSMARLQLDAADAVAVQHTHSPERNDSMSESKTAVARIDGIEYEVAPEVERHISRQDEQVADLSSKLEAATAEVDTATAKADEAKAEIERLNEAYSDEAIRDAAKDRVALERSAAKVLGDDADMGDMSDREIREAVCKKVHDGLDLTDRSDVYVEARFDAALELHQGDAVASQRAAAGSVNPEPKQDARETAMADIRNAHKRNK